MVVSLKRIGIALLLLICATSAFGGSTARQVDFLAAGLEKDGDPCTGCKVYTYETGTTTAKTTYLDRLKAGNQTNPIILDSEGRAEVFADGLYTMVIKTVDDRTPRKCPSLAIMLRPHYDDAIKIREMKRKSSIRRPVVPKVARDIDSEVFKYASPHPGQARAWAR